MPGTNLAHILKELLTTPPVQAPIVVVLLGTTDAQRPIDTAAPAQELPAAQLDLAVIDPGHALADDIPIFIGVEVFGPSVNKTRSIRMLNSSRRVSRIR